MINNELFFLGLNCDEELFSRNIQEKDELGYGSIIAGFFFAAFVVIAMVLAGWIYHRRRVADLKNEIAQVQYIAEPPSPPGIYEKKLFIYNYLEMSFL